MHRPSPTRRAAPRRLPFRRGVALLALGLSGGLGTSCFIETDPPPTFRYSCNGDGDCPSGESCDAGLCQVACSAATFNEDCPAEDGYATCFNGHCTHVCQPSEDRCSRPQRCLPLPGGAISEDDGGDSLSDFGFCAQPCDETGCDDGETCLEGVCLATCDEMSTDPLQCGSAATCIGGLCIPDEAFSQ